MCLTLMVYHEAGNQPVKGKMATLEVVQNRVNSKDFPNDYCSVIKQKGQFSWVKSHNRSLNKIPSKVSNNKLEKQSWDLAKDTASKFLRSKSNYTNGAIYFNTANMGVRYKTRTRSVRIGNHVFY